MAHRIAASREEVEDLRPDSCVVATTIAHLQHIPALSFRQAAQLESKIPKHRWGNRRRLVAILELLLCSLELSQKGRHRLRMTRLAQLRVLEEAIELLLPVPSSCKLALSCSKSDGSRQIKVSAAAFRKLRSNLGPPAARSSAFEPRPSTNAFALWRNKKISCGVRALYTGTFGSGSSSRLHTAVALATLTQQTCLSHKLSTPTKLQELICVNASAPDTILQLIAKCQLPLQLQMHSNKTTAPVPI